MGNEHCPREVLDVGTYRSSTSPWLTSVRALANSDLEITVCTVESSGGMQNTGGGTCRTYQGRATPGADGVGTIRYWSATGPLLVHYWSTTGPALVQPWSSLGPG